MTSSRIAAMKVIDKEESVKFLFDASSGNYVIFDNYNLSSYYANNYYAAARFFNKRIALSTTEPSTSFL
jgi:hypothetical protein